MHKSQTALITGGAKRIGAGMALYLAKMGYDIVISYHKSKDDAEKLAEKIIQEAKVKSSIVKANLLNKQEAFDLANWMRKNHQNWSLLINNASIFTESKLTTMADDEIDKNMAIHLQSPLILSKEFYHHCNKFNISGNIINMVDKNIVRYDTKYFAYNLSKKALAEFTKLSALELAPQIRVNAIAPGFILNGVNVIDCERETKNLIQKIPLKKQGNLNNINLALRHFLENDFLNGQIISVDGGSYLNHGG